MALTVIEFANVDEAGQPIHPGSRNVAVSLPYQLADATRYAAVMSTVAGNLRISDDGAAASTGDLALEANKNYGFAVRKGAKPKLNFA